jgi:hypothetical protein
VQTFLLISLPRSGSTWTSQAIASATRSRLLHEPFNWKRYPEREKFHMLYLSAGSDQRELIELIEKESTPEIPIIGKLMKAQPVVIKDVHICLAVEYVWEQIKPYIIILIRHPCGMANSWMKLSYEVRFRLDLLLSQDDLMADHLALFENHLLRRDNKWFEIGAYWGAIYYVLDQLSQAHCEWMWVTHEELCVNSVHNFQILLNKINFNNDPKVQKRLHLFLDHHNRSILENKTYSTSRISADEPEKWRRNMTGEQIKSVINGAEPFGIMQKYYNSFA